MCGGASVGLGFNPKPCGLAKPEQETIDRHLSATQTDREEKDDGDSGDETGGGDESGSVSSEVRRE
jgi:hypothetical protein